MIYRVPEWPCRGSHGTCTTASSLLVHQQEAVGGEVYCCCWLAYSLACNCTHVGLICYGSWLLYAFFVMAAGYGMLAQSVGMLPGPLGWPRNV